MLKKLLFFTAAFVFSTLSVLAADQVTFNLNTGKSGQHVSFVSDLTYWNSNPLTMEEKSPGVYSVAIPAPWVFQFSYKFVVDDLWITDPNNNKRLPDGFGGWNSSFQTHFQDEPYLTKPDPYFFEPLEIHVKDWEGDIRTIKILRPKTTQGKRLVVIYVHDGDGYLEYAYINNLLANLSKDPDMPTFAGVFLNAKDRDREYFANDDYAEFVAQTVVPAAEDALHAHISPNDRMVSGISLGGLISFYITLKHPDVFPNCTSQSGSLWFQPERMHEILNGLKGRSDLRFVIQMGLYDEDYMLKGSRDMAQKVQEMGFNSLYLEFPGTHDWVPWRNTLQATIRYFFQEPLK